jgi:hypothetical protein
MVRTLSMVGLTALLLTAGCTGMDSTQQRMLSGGAMGAAAGAGLGAVTGGLSVVGGAAIGAAAGAATGYVIDQTD